MCPYFGSLRQSFQMWAVLSPAALLTLLLLRRGLPATEQRRVILSESFLPSRNSTRRAVASVGGPVFSPSASLFLSQDELSCAFCACPLALSALSFGPSFPLPPSPFRGRLSWHLRSWRTCALRTRELRSGPGICEPASSGSSTGSRSVCFQGLL